MYPFSGERSAVDDRVQRCEPGGCTSSLSLGMLRCMMQQVMSRKIRHLQRAVDEACSDR